MDGVAGAVVEVDQEDEEERRTRRCGATENASQQKPKAAISIAVAASRSAIPLCPNIIILIIISSFLHYLAPITEQNGARECVICLLALTTTQKIADRSNSVRRFKEWMMHIPRVTVALEIITTTERFFVFAR